MHWLIEDFDVQPLLNAGLPETLLRQFFDHSSTYLVIKPGHNAQDALLPNATRVSSFSSYTLMYDAVTGGKIPAGCRYLLYDNESWSATPAAEQADPLRYAAQADQLAHAHGYGLIFTPAADLAPVLSRSYTSKTRFTGYLSLNMASGARYSDVFDIQAQQIETEPTFDHFVTAAAGQASAANAHAQILVGLTTAVPDAGVVTSSALVNAFNQVKGEVSGFWLNLPGGPSFGNQPQGASSAVAFLENVAGELGYHS